MKKTFVFQPRIIRSPRSDFYGREIEDSLQSYPEDYLREIAGEGYDGIWLHAVLRDITHSGLFPDRKPEKTGILRKLVEKTNRFGIKVYFYLCEPRGFRAEDSFWQEHPNFKGQGSSFVNISEQFDGTYHALCTGNAAVREFLEESAYNLFRSVPGVGGAFLINASEFVTHCYSHYQKRTEQVSTEFLENDPGRFTCPRCAVREPNQVAAEVITLLNRGIKSASPGAKVISWTWSWSILEPDPQPELIRLLPKDVILMSDWERGGRKKVCGKSYELDEYSFSSLGPSPRFRKQLALAKARGMRMMAKIQIGTTHELAAVPYLPLPYLLAEKLRRMKQCGVDGYLGCWIFGGEISPMSKTAGLMSRQPQLGTAKAVKTVALDEFGPESAGAVCRAWRKFSRAWRAYPFSIPFIYDGPINYAVAWPLRLDAQKIPPFSGWMPLPRDRSGHLKSGDNLDHWLKPFGPDIAVQAFGELLAEWDQGIAILRTASGRSNSERLRKELVLAEYIALSIRSTINIIRFYTLGRRLEKPVSGAERNKLFGQLKTILQDEAANTCQAQKMLEIEPRLGYHPEAHVHLFTRKDLEYKMTQTAKTISKIRRFEKTPG